MPLMPSRQTLRSAASLEWFAATLRFLSVALILLELPLVTSRLLPWYEGAASVWIISVAVTQVLVLAGFAVAQLIRRIPSLRAQVFAFLSIVLLSVATLPLLPRDAWRVDGLADPTGWLVLTLLGSVGLPVVALSAAGSLIGSWRLPPETDCNAAARWAIPTFAALVVTLAYPVAIEPLVTVPQQSNIWAVLFVLCGAGVGIVGFRLATLRSSIADQHNAMNPPDAIEAASAVTPPPKPRSIGATSVALLLGAVPSVLMLAIMQDLMTQVAAASWLGLLPLAVYGTTLVLPAIDRRFRRPGLAAAGFVAAVALLATGSRTTQLPLQIAVDLGILFSIGMLCHGWLTEQSETAGIGLSASAAGGAFVAFVAPRVFSGHHEFLLAMLVSSALVLWQAWQDLNGSRAGWRLTGLFAGVILIAATWGLGRGWIEEQRDRLVEQRSFYGVVRVDAPLADLAASAHRTLLHGRYPLGMQYQGEDRRRRPVSSVGPTTGVGQVLNNRVSQAPRAIGVVGLGTGALAAYCDPQDTIRFYEGNPALAAITGEYFDYLKAAEGKADVVVGNPRVALVRETERGMPGLDLLVLDSLSRSSTPLHLLTRDAMSTYLERLSPRGILAIQLSNRHIDLESVVADLANEFELKAAVVVSRPEGPGEAMSIWALLARDESVLKTESLAGVRPLRERRRVPWQDRYSNLFASLKPFRAEGLFPTEEPDSRLTRAAAATQEKRWDVAEECYRELVATDPTKIDYYLRLGDLCRYRGEPDRSVEWYSAALKIDQKNAAAHNSLGSVLARKDPTTARKYFLAAIECDATLPDPHVNLGNLLFRSGRVHDAVKEYQTALQLRPDDLAAIENLRQAMAMLKSPPTKRNAPAALPAL